MSAIYLLVTALLTLEFIVKFPHLINIVHALHVFWVIFLKTARDSGHPFRCFWMQKSNFPPLCFKLNNRCRRIINEREVVWLFKIMFQQPYAIFIAVKHFSGRHVVLPA